MNVFSSFFQKFFGVHNENGSETTSNKDILHMKIKRSMVFEGGKIQHAFLGPCCVFNDHKRQA